MNDVVCLKQGPGTEAGRPPSPAPDKAAGPVRKALPTVAGPAVRLAGDRFTVPPRLTGPVNQAKR